MTVLKRAGSKNWYVQFQQDGKTFVRSTKTTDKKLAQQLEAKWRKMLVSNNAWITKVI